MNKNMQLEMMTIMHCSNEPAADELCKHTVDKLKQNTRLVTFHMRIVNKSLCFVICEMPKLWLVTTTNF